MFALTLRYQIVIAELASVLTAYNMSMKKNSQAIDGQNMEVLTIGLNKILNTPVLGFRQSQ